MSSKLVVLICLAAALTGGMLYATMTSSRTHAAVNQRLVETFSRWKQIHGKLYASPAENDFRLSVFAEQMSFIEKKNQEYDAYMAMQGKTLSGPMFEMNMFGDLTNEEFEARFTGHRPPTEDSIAQLAETAIPEPVVPQSSNSQNYLGQLPEFKPKVRNQGSCGSCWAFAAVIEMERLHYLKTGQYVDMAIQELVDCVARCSGCNGGLSEHAYNYVYQNGIGKANDYPYLGANTPCVPKSDRTRFAEFSWISFIGQFSVTKAHKAAKAKVIPAVSLKGNGVFRYLAMNDNLYDARLSGECDSGNSHSVGMLTAYKTPAGEDVVQIINSWGPWWGFQGTKKIIPCNENSLLGVGATWASPYAF